MYTINFSINGYSYCHNYTFNSVLDLINHLDYLRKVYKQSYRFTGISLVSYK
jgi:hypothetical protein